MSVAIYDRRRAARYMVRVPIEVNQIRVGSTIDISATGVAFFSDSRLELGLEIAFELRLENDLLHCNGRVVRVEERGQHLFTAATIDELVVGSTREH